jgi:hypothetical protein
MATEKFTLKAMIEANTKDFEKGMKNVNAGLGLAGGKMAKFAKIGKAGFAAIGVAAAAAGVAIATKFIIASTKSFIEFEDQMTKTAAIMGRQSMDDIPRLNEKVRELGETTRSTALQVGEAAQILALAGLGEEDMVDKGALENLNNLSIAAGVDIPTAAGVAIASLKGMQLETEELGRVNDVLLQTMTGSFVSLETLGETMKMLAPTASAVGISIEEASAAAGALGNAGIQGTMAGTGLRMAINKLIAPTDSARRVMEDLGLDVLRLTPVGESAKNALFDVQDSLNKTKMEADATKMAMQSLTNELEDLSIEQQSNNLAIMKIRQRAAQQGRELTDQELSQIDRLEMANDSLNIKMSERQLEMARTGRENRRLSESITEQEAEVATLNQTVADQTDGLTSLTDLFNQLAASGVSTAQVLELFGVRGGNAINAILGQKEAFEDLVEANENAEGRTAKMAETMGGTTRNAVLELQSAIAGFMLDVGEQFAPMLKEEVIPALIEMIEALLPMVPELARMAAMFGTILPPRIEAMIPVLQALMDNADSLAGIMFLVGKSLEFAIYFFQPITQLIGGLGNAVSALMDGDLMGFFSALYDILEAIFKIGNPLIRIVEAGAKVMGFGDGRSVKEKAQDDPKGTIGKAAVGAGVGFLVGGPVGAAAGGYLAAKFLEEGGVATGPTLAMIGEGREPEAVLPLSALDTMLNKHSAQAEVSTRSGEVSITINGGITINHGLGNRVVDAIAPHVVESSVGTAMKTVIKKSGLLGNGRAL